MKIFVLLCFLDITYGTVGTVEVVLKLNIDNTKLGNVNVANVKYNVPKVEDYNEIDRGAQRKDKVVKVLDEKKRDVDEDEEKSEEEEEEQKAVKYEKEEVVEGESRFPHYLGIRYFTRGDCFEEICKGF